MKLRVLPALLLALSLLNGCKKDPAAEPDQQENPGPVTDPLLFGMSWTPTSQGVTTVWSGKDRDTSIVGYKHPNLVVAGFYERSVVSPGGIAKGIDYYGNEVTNDHASRLCQFLQVSTPFAVTTGRQLNSRYVEWAQGSTTYKGNTYIIATGSQPGQWPASSYYYKVSGADGKPTFHPLAQTPNGNGYGWYCGTEKGLLVFNSLSPDTKKTFLTAYREDQWLQDYKLDAPGYIYMDIESVFAKDADHLIVIVDGKKEGTPITGLFYFMINLVDHSVKRYQADMPEVNYHINTGTYANNTVYLPYYENASNKCAYVTIKFDDQLNILITKKIDLPAKAGVSYGSTNLVATNGHNVYTAGEQGAKACYWRNDKLVEIENKDATASAITKIAVFD